MFKTLEIEKRAIISIDLCEKTLKIKSKHLKYQKKLEISLRRIKTDRLNLKKIILKQQERWQRSLLYITIAPDSFSFIDNPIHDESPKWDREATYSSCWKDDDRKSKAIQHRLPTIQWRSAESFYM